jgi:hypothetical protein
LIGDLFSGALGLIEDRVSCGERDRFTNLLIDKRERRFDTSTVAKLLHIGAERSKNGSALMCHAVLSNYKSNGS